MLFDLNDSLIDLKNESITKNMNQNESKNDPRKNLTIPITNTQNQKSVQPKIHFKFNKPDNSLNFLKIETNNNEQKKQNPLPKSHRFKFNSSTFKNEKPNNFSVPNDPPKQDVSKNNFQNPGNTAKVYFQVDPTKSSTTNLKTNPTNNQTQNQQSHHESVNSKKRVALFLDFDKTIIPESSYGMPKTNKTKMMEESYYASVIRSLKTIYSKIMVSENIEFVGIFVLTRGITFEVLKYMRQHQLMFDKKQGNCLFKGVYGSLREKDMFPNSKVTLHKRVLFESLALEHQKHLIKFDQKKDIFAENVSLRIDSSIYSTHESKWAYIKSFMVYELMQIFKLDHVLFDDDNESNVLMVERLENVDFMRIAQMGSPVFNDPLVFYQTFSKWMEKIEKLSQSKNINRTVSFSGFPQVSLNKKSSFDEH